MVTEQVYQGDSFKSSPEVSALKALHRIVKAFYDVLDAQDIIDFEKIFSKIPIKKPFVKTEGEPTLKEIKSLIGLKDYIGQFVSLTTVGNRSRGLCPFHSEKNPSFYVDDDTFHCFGCQAHGDVFDFLMKHHKISLPEALERLRA